MYKLAIKYMVTCHARNMLAKNGSSTLRFGPPGPQNISNPIIRVETSKLSYRAHRVLIQKLSTRQTFSETKCSVSNSFENMH